ncbi:MAG: hypothetical protein HOP15_03895 [Planctomycetes bacterium]|nr:hypothetical protein [Planctomycetota bacterium]
MLRARQGDHERQGQGGVRADPGRRNYFPDGFEEPKEGSVLRVGNLAEVLELCERCP